MYRGAVGSVGQALWPALGEGVKPHSLRRGVLSLPNVTVRREPSFRLTGGLGLLSDPQPSLHQVAARSTPRCRSPLVPHRGNIGVGSIAVFAYNRNLHSRAHALKQQFRRPTLIVFTHRRLFPPIDLLPIDTDGNHKNVTHPLRFFIPQPTLPRERW